MFFLFRSQGLWEDECLGSIWEIHRKNSVFFQFVPFFYQSATNRAGGRHIAYLIILYLKTSTGSVSFLK